MKTVDEMEAEARVRVPEPKAATFEELCTRIADIRAKLAADLTATFGDFSRGVMGVAIAGQHLPDIHQRALLFAIKSLEGDLKDVVETAINKAAAEEIAKAGAE